MNEEDNYEALLEALQVEKTFEEPLMPAYGGFIADIMTGELKMAGYYFWSAWNKNGKFLHKDIAYRNKEGKFHRLYGPSYISLNYDFEIWCKEGLIHRDVGPAIRHKDIFMYYKDGELHRLDGPAVVHRGGPKQYWIEGQKLSPKQYKIEIERRKRKGQV
jgi:hypothetical protein